MGSALSNRVLSDRGDNIERGIACYSNALHVCTREAVPHYWVCLHMNMGKCGVRSRAGQPRWQHRARYRVLLERPARQNAQGNAS
jgi:hypothetical protein